MKRNLKLVTLLTALCLLLTACGQPAKATADVSATQETQTEEAATEAASEEEAQAEAETAETEQTEAETAEETTVETTEEVTTEEETTENTTQEAVVKSEASEEAAKERAPIVVTRFDEMKTLYAVSAVNIRRGPSTDYDRAGSLAMADEVNVLGQADTGWYFFMKNGEPVYVSDKYLSETKPELPPPAPAQPAAPAGQPQATVAPAGVIMIGDSRCVQMQEAVGGGGCSWICENSKEITWFCDKAIPWADPSIGRGTKVVINMGVNDPDHYQKYVEVVNAKAAEWAARGATTYFVSVNPVWENPYTDQEDVDTFNAQVPGMLSGVRWIDTSSWLTANGYRLVDGLHYDAPTYVNIFNLIMGSL